MSRPIDLELKKAFTELQIKLVETSKKIQVIDAQMGVLERVLKLMMVTQREINILPPDTKTYESVGRMFLLQDCNDIKKNLENKVAQLTARITESANSKEYLEKNLKESEDNIREMVQQKKDSEAKAH